MKVTCSWPTTPLYQAYHDYEWGRPIHDDQRQFEHLCLESLQCGLSWLTILNKREIIRQCFDYFDVDAVAKYTETDIERIMSTEGMLKSRKKIEAIINNAQAFQRIQAEFGSFCEYIWAFTNHKTLIYKGHSEGRVTAKNELSTRISKDLKKRGLKFVGPVTIYSHLQASGLINDHGKDCPCFNEINEANPVVYMTIDD
ncbi:MAG: DNA-3-methyladenine glycosylase I [Veillonella sp.]|uniref:DNA-3-methyladenine glycosylase I n=1 Tax=Veillonella sp. TaxID=1926307 RepID=UPI002906A357|nr:DNA-3-methyladenine glycosylase I [Veillonella sp.]MDU5646905.1 DNA-3-methyladenine glycosylase I [Veillonella sp.]